MPRRQLGEVRWVIRVLRACALLIGLMGLAGGSALARGSGSPTLDAVRARGELRCGTGGEIPGFSMVDSGGVMRGLDADYCRGVAAAVFGDAGKVKFVPVTAQTRFTALQSGEIDMLVRNTGWSLTRESSLGLEFAGVNFWDGTSIIVKTASGLKSVKQLGGATICVLPGTTTELDLADWARRETIAYTPVLIGSLSEIRQAFLAGRCDAYTTDSSQLAGFRYMQGQKAADLTILPEPIGLGPSGAVVRKGDDKWLDVVKWTHYAAVVGEYLGVTSQNVDTFKDTQVPDIRRLLGTESDLGKSMGLDNAWAANIIRQVGAGRSAMVIRVLRERGGTCHLRWPACASHDVTEIVAAPVWGHPPRERSSNQNARPTSTRPAAKPAPAPQ